MMTRNNFYDKKIVSMMTKNIILMITKNHVDRDKKINDDKKIIFMMIKDCFDDDLKSCL